MFLGKLQSGYLLYETQQGMVRVEPSFGQRFYLLWTFRNFRQLSIPLLNSRQRALVNALFRTPAGVVSGSSDPLLVIGVVENFVPPIAPAPVPPAVKKERPKKVATPRVEITPKPGRVHSAWPRIAWTKIATTVGALSVCIISAVAWHRGQGVPGSQAHNQPQFQGMDAITATNSPPAEKPAGKVGSLRPHTSTAGTASSGAVVRSALITAIRPTAKQATRASAPLTPDSSLSGQDSPILASRPPLRFVYPAYPDVPARGVVALTARVDSDGTVRSVKVVIGNRALAAAAVRAVRQWRYRPYLQDGQPVATGTNIVISFISDDAISMSFPPSLPASH